MKIIQLLLWLILAYFVILHGLYFLLLAIGAWQHRRYKDDITYTEFLRIAKSQFTMPVSLIIPAYNEATIIVETIRCAFNLKFPLYEVLVVNDGSTDETMKVLIETFNLRRVDKFGPKHIPTNAVLGIYESPDHPNFVVVDKKNGRRADAINAGVTLSTYPLLCVIDADCLLDPDGLLRLVRPFLRDSRVAAVAGMVRPSNGLTVKNGQITRAGLPGTWLGVNQEIEYARSFQWARMGLCRLQSMLCISGALMMIRKSLYETVGGSSSSAITDDIEFTMRLNAHIYDRRNKQQFSLALVPDAVCYTEVPETFKTYASQRNRWQRGTLQALFRNWRMLLNPRYGITGLFGMPYFFLFEGFSAIVELSAWVLAVVCLVLGLATVWEVLLMIYLAYILNVLLTLAAILLSETTRLRASSWGDLSRMMGSVFLDGIGFHLFHLMVRAAGTIQYLVFRRQDLGAPIPRMTPKAGTP